MSGFVVLGTDTDAGKTTFSLIWLARFAAEYAYWKPVETGPSRASRSSKSINISSAGRIASRKESIDRRTGAVGSVVAMVTCKS